VVPKSKFGTAIAVKTNVGALEIGMVQYHLRTSTVANALITAQAKLPYNSMIATSEATNGGTE
jgi:ribosomal protein L16/L10AE